MNRPKRYISHLFKEGDLIYFGPFQNTEVGFFIENSRMHKLDDASKRLINRYENNSGFYEIKEILERRAARGTENYKESMIIEKMNRGGLFKPARPNFHDHLFLSLPEDKWSLEETLEGESFIVHEGLHSWADLYHVGKEAPILENDGHHELGPNEFFFERIVIEPISEG